MKSEKIARWPKVKQVCYCRVCKSYDIHVNPEFDYQWGCAGCGLESVAESSLFEFAPIGNVQNYK